MQPSPPPRRRLRRRGLPRRQPRRLGCVTLLALLVFVLIFVNVLPTPWALHIGGRFTPLESWDGYGQVKASNGGRYVLSANLRGGLIGTHGRPDCSMQSGCDTLHGSAKMCTENGKTYSFALSGAVHSWLSTNGAKTNIDLTGGSPTPLPDGWTVAFDGMWHGPVLSLASPDNSFTEVFTPRGEIRTTTSTADAGTAILTLQYGSAADFSRACRALAAH
jgi:hypothetical protein